MVKISLIFKYWTKCEEVVKFYVKHFLQIFILNICWNEDKIEMQRFEHQIAGLNDTVWQLPLLIAHKFIRRTTYFSKIRSVIDDVTIDTALDRERSQFKDRFFTAIYFTWKWLSSCRSNVSRFSPRTKFLLSSPYCRAVSVITHSLL